MALTQGIDAIKQAVPAFTALKTSVVSAFQGMTTASKAFMLTGIGLVITAIAAAVAAFDGMGKSTEEIIAANKKATKSFDDYSASIENNKNQIRANTDNQVAYAEAAGRSEEYIAKIREKGAKKIIFENNKEIKNQQDKIKQLLSEDTKLALGRQASSKDQYDALIKNNQKEAAQAKEHLNKLKIENNNARNQIKIDTLKTKTDEIDGIKAKEEEERQAAADRAKQRASESAQQRRDALAQLREAQNEFTEQERLSYMTEQEREVYEVNKKYEELIKLAQKYKQDTAILKENQLNEVNNINTKYAQEDLTAEAETKAR
jgi:hypothetical protein